jgi:3'(2'), 5'-bisphosphate nucleotidase
VKALLEIAIRAAIDAGKEILEVYSTSFGIELKDDRSPLTEADKRAHLVIQKALSATALPLLSEEGRSIPFEERKAWNRFWLVDPLDGTKEFIRRNGEFTVNIALIENGQPVAGVIFVPVTGVLYFGSAETGSYINEHPEGAENWEQLLNNSVLLPRKSGERLYTVVGSRSHLSSETETFISALRKKYGELNFISQGSSIKICLVAEGKADVYPRLSPTMEWDTAAGHAIAKAAGCTVLTWPGETELRYNKENLLNPFFVVSAS